MQKSEEIFIFVGRHFGDLIVNSSMRRRNPSTVISEASDSAGSLPTMLSVLHDFCLRI